MTSTILGSLHTVRDFIRFAVSRFNEAGVHYGHGTTNAYDEAVYLVLYALHLPPDSLEPYLDARLTRPERAAILRVIERRIQERIPAAYLTQEAWLQGYKFFVDERVIVPRSFIAELLSENLAPWVLDPETIVDVLDVCTGSGCLAILAAQAFPNAKITALDISPQALQVAERNVADYGLQERIKLVESDVFSQVGNKKFDVILSNPPYVPAASMATLPAEYRAEPALALAAGEDGLAVIHRLIREGTRYLNNNGLLVVEVGHERHAVEAAYPKLSLTWVTTSGGDDQVFILQSDRESAQHL